MGGEHDAITAGEFGRFRDDLDGRLIELRTDIRDGFANLNGRTRSQAEAIVALDTKILHIASRGCARYDEHREVLDGLAGGGLSKKRQAVTAAGAGAGLVGVIEIARAVVTHFWK